MKFVMGPVTFSIQRTIRDPLNNWDADHLKGLDELVAAWSPTPLEGLPELQAAVTVSSLDSSENWTEAAACLREFGIVIVPNFVDAHVVEAAAQSAYALANSIESNRKQDENQGKYRVSRDADESYYELAESRTPTVVVRRGTDSGMLDIFNFDLLDGSYGPALRAALASPSVVNLVSLGKSSGLKPRNLNVYINRKVTKTRGFHVDSYGAGQIKAFLYLTDVTTMSDGPYCYVLGSHTRGPLSQMNQAITRESSFFESTDTPLVDTRKILPVLGGAGTLVISDQSGSHRGIPQTADGSRVLAVLNLLPEK